MKDKAVKSFYENMDIVDLLQVVCKDLSNLLESKEYSNEKLHEHFIAAHELISRVQINHSYHNVHGENIITPSGYCMDEAILACDALERLDLPDGEIIAFMPIGKYKAARKTPEIEWY